MMSRFLITDVRLFDGQAVLEHASVLVEAGRIVKVSSTSIEFDGLVISRPGHTLMPGFIDSHVHIDFGNESGLAQGLRFGVTTQCDLGNAPFQIDKLREMVKEGDCSDLKAAMDAATPNGGWPAPILKPLGIELPPSENPFKTREDGRKFVRTQVQGGADYIKILHECGSAFGMELPTLPAEVEEGMVEEAHKSGLRIVAHAFTLQDALEVLARGVDGTAHTFLDKPPTDALVEAYRKHNAFCNPTLVVIGSLTTDGREMQEAYAHDPRVQGLLSASGRENMCKCIAMAKPDSGNLRNAIETVKKLKEAGIDILCGTDSNGPAAGTAFGLSLHQELAMLVKECGFSPLEALRSATMLPAKRLNFPDRGSIREGLRADLVLVEGDPTQDIDRTLDLRGVWIAGELCSHYRGRV